MSLKPRLKLDWCSHQAARFAVMNWHYSQAMPVGKLIKIGVWENDEFIGVVLFGRGASMPLYRKHRLSQTELCELTRVALRDHFTPVSRIISIACRMVAKNNPGLRLIVSFADQNHGHHGGIYQAACWLYLGESIKKSFIINGRNFHTRSLAIKYGARGQSLKWLRKNISSHIEYGSILPKYKYALPLDTEMRATLLPLTKPYPKRTKRATDVHHTSSGGSTPTRALHIS